LPTRGDVTPRKSHDYSSL